MPAGDPQSRIPVPVVRRLVKYLGHVQYLQGQGRRRVRSWELAEAFALTEATVRRDVSFLPSTGGTGRGYEIARLECALAEVLGLNPGRKAVIVGAGGLGRALALTQSFSEYGFEVCGIFDVTPEVIGQQVGALVVQSMEELPGVVRRNGVSIGIIAAPAVAARVAALELVAAGVQGILNVASAHLPATAGVVVVNARLVESLQELSGLMQSHQDSEAQLF